MLLLLDTDGGEKKFNSLLIYSLPTKISVNVNYPNHFHVWRMKTEKSQCLYFLLVEERVNCKYFQYLLITHFSHPRCSHFPWSCPFPQPGHKQLTPDKAGKHCSTFCLRTAPSWGQGRKCSACPTHPTEQLWSSRLLLSALCRAKKAPSCQGWGWKELCRSGRRALGWIQSCWLRFFPGDFSWESPSCDPCVLLVEHHQHLSALVSVGSAPQTQTSRVHTAPAVCSAALETPAPGQSST